MSKNNTQHELVPRLRFPEFRDAPGWQPTPLSHVLDYERPDRYIVADTDYVESGTPVLTANKSFILGYTNETDGVFEDVPVIIFDDFTTDKKFVDFPFKVKSSAIKILKGKRKDQLKLVYELMTGIRFDPTQHKRYYISEYQHLDVPLPKEKEQQKIADCLGSLDDLIAAEGRKLAALRDHKKGLMQQVFPRNGETRPRLRFPEFQDAGKWEESTVGSKCNSFSGGTPDTTKKEFYGGTIHFIRSAEIGSDTTAQFLTEEGFTSSAAKMVDRGDVLVALYGANSGDVALARVDGAINQAILCLRPEGSKAFLYHYLTQKKPWILATYLQGGQGNLSGDIVKSVSLRFPSPEEQETIADCLSSLDAMIAAQAVNLDALRTHKRGLMQQLFPSPEDAEA